MSYMSRQLEYLIDLTAPDMWTPEEHNLFSRKFRDNIRATLLAAHVGASLCDFPRRPIHPRVALECMEFVEPEDNQVLGAIVAAGDPEEDDYDDEDDDTVDEYEYQTLPRNQRCCSCSEHTEDEDTGDDNSLFFKRRRLE